MITPRPKPKTDRVITCLKNASEITERQLVTETGVSRGTVARRLCEMYQDGKIIKRLKPDDKGAYRVHYQFVGDA